MQVGIVVPKRPEFGNAYWAVQRRFDAGFHVLEVDERELAELRADPVVALVQGAELEAMLAAATAPPTPPAPAAPPAGPGKPLKRG